LFLRLSNCASVGEKNKTFIIIDMHDMYVKISETVISGLKA